MSEDKSVLIQMICENIPDAMYILDTNGNTLWYRLLGLVGIIHSAGNKDGNINMLLDLGRRRQYDIGAQA